MSGQAGTVEQIALFLGELLQPLQKASVAARRTNSLRGSDSSLRTVS
jgi:hypothetical protein